MSLAPQPIDFGQSLSEGLELERSMFLRVAAGADAHEGASAFIERRRARFQHA